MGWLQGRRGGGGGKGQSRPENPPCPPAEPWEAPEWAGPVAGAAIAMAAAAGARALWAARGGWPPASRRRQGQRPPRPGQPRQTLLNPVPPSPDRDREGAAAVAGGDGPALSEASTSEPRLHRPAVKLAVTQGPDRGNTYLLQGDAEQVGLLLFPAAGVGGGQPPPTQRKGTLPPPPPGLTPPDPSRLPRPACR